MTWRELANQIRSLPEEAQDMEANVWLPMDYEPIEHEFPVVIGLSAFDGDMPYSVKNFASISIEEG